MALAVAARRLVFTLALMPAAWHAIAARSARHQASAHSSLQASAEALEAVAVGAHDTPVTRVVNLLKEVQKSLAAEMEEDESLYDKLKCWCNDNEYEKQTNLEASTAKVSELEASIEGLSAKSSELKASIEELETQLDSDKKALAEATELREKQRKEFHGGELDSTQAIENLRAALEVLSKHQAAPESSVAGGPVFKTPQDSWEALVETASKSRTASGEERMRSQDFGESLLALKSKSRTTLDGEWTREHEASHLARPLEEFMRHSGFDVEEAVADVAAPPPAAPSTGGFLQSEPPAPRGAPEHAAGMPLDDTAVVNKALRSAAAFVQAHHREGYYPSYNAQSGEIIGVLKQLKEEMEADLSEAQKNEQAQASSFEELRSAKSSQIQTAEKMSEQKEDELATAQNSLAGAKEDLGQEQAAAANSQEFLAGLEDTCAKADKNFQARKSKRTEEIQVVTRAMEVLTGDEARDAMSSTFGFIQRSTSTKASQRRQQAAAALRMAARRTHNPQLSLLATSVELNAFTKVKAAIDKMIGMLKVEQDDEVKKNDFCKAEIQENEMETERKTDFKEDLQTKGAQLAETIETLDAGITEAKRSIAQLQVDLQRASENRKAENLDFQKSLADQMLTVKVVMEALNLLAAFYEKEDKESLFLQNGNEADSVQTPPVAQMEYKPSKAAAGVMELLEKVALDAKALAAEAVVSENAAQAAYEQTIAETNASVEALQKAVSTKSKAKAVAAKDKLQVESDIADTSSELDGLSKYNNKIHAECDYLLKNFEVRQSARAQEVEALQQAKQILSGATYN
uniref:Uncharacterized protein n=1 Tax=Pyrodinium bahamense TaxID=73915 RepID=A0A7S0AJP9_9DINO